MSKILSQAHLERLRQHQGFAKASPGAKRRIFADQERSLSALGMTPRFASMRQSIMVSM